MGLLSHNIILNTCKHSKLTLNRYVKLVGIINNLLCHCYVLVVGKGGTVNHDRGEAVVYAFFTCLKAVTVVKVENNGNVITQFMCIFCCTAGHVSENIHICIISCAL